MLSSVFPLYKRIPFYTRTQSCYQKTIFMLALHPYPLR